MLPIRGPKLIFYGGGFYGGFYGGWRIWKRHYLSQATYDIDVYVDINECEQQPCQNNGTCANTVGSYICACPTGYNGTNCEFGKKFYEM